MKQRPSVTIAILTFQRLRSLEAAIESIRIAVGPAKADVVEVLVVDNDAEPSAEQFVTSIEWPILRYVHEPTAGVAVARNRALDEASGDVLLFIDDDERAGPGWPDGLLTVMTETGAALVGGPVRSVFATQPPQAIEASGFFNRDEPPDLATVSWLRSGNLAIDLQTVRSHKLRFDLAFNRSGGEDSRFSTEAARAGLGLRWSAHAVVYEDVTGDRITRDWVLQRSRGAMTSFVRAQAPLGATATIRTLCLAVVRASIGCVNVVAGRLLRSETRELLGRIAMARSAGALTGCWQAVVPKTDRQAESSHYGNG